ncbi:ABC transporter ATP-binding protein [Maritalea myrionectae]|uniref:ABC transporter ATP-binding protein n=1 Tax=Maritalea myrionectae TaxID=454601 RepID=UPI0004234FF7|nr:ABC transporter ATP-binding protein [Maritalea myrionectae]
MALLSVQDLSVKFGGEFGAVSAVKNVSFDLHRGERLGIVGESGAGKSITGFALMNLLSAPGFINRGKVLFDGKDIVRMSERQLRKVRGNRMAMIFQDPLVTLNPVLTIGQQMIETLLAHRRLRRDEAEFIAIQKLREVYISSPEMRMSQYPHELSGGMRQRVIIAIALLLDPDLIIADEPTTALDVTTQADILELLLHLCMSNNVSLILITHDLGVVCQLTERIMVMYAGEVVETGKTREVINDPQHPYTQGLISALPQQTLPGHTLKSIKGYMPSLLSMPSGCPFHPRCAYALDECREHRPKLVHYRDASVACHEVNRLHQETLAE